MGGPGRGALSAQRQVVFGDRFQQTTLDVLERLVEATYTRRRRDPLGGANLGLEKLRFLLRLPPAESACAGWPAPPRGKLELQCSASPRRRLNTSNSTGGQGFPVSRMLTPRLFFLPTSSGDHKAVVPWSIFSPPGHSMGVDAVTLVRG